jgi:glutathione synthase/RimK-type ligase-like ATP-grasp enzyme
MILIISNKWDVTVDFVVRELQDRGYPYFRLNTEDLPDLDITTQLPNLSATIEGQGATVDVVEQVGAVWYRRPGKPYEFVVEEERPDDGTLEYVQEQWSAWLKSLQAIDGLEWVNHPEENQRVESKIYQLQLANKIGFAIPETVVTNDGSSVTEFFDEQGESVISKALSSPLIEGRENDEFVFSVHLEERPSENDESLSISPTIFQEPILPKVDYRVTVVGDEVFPVKIGSESSGGVPVDWRVAKDDASFVQEKLPERVEELCRDFVQRAGLVFGAIDLVKRNDEFVFLEINPNGEWGWLQKPWGVPIAESLTDILIELDHSEELCSG